METTNTTATAGVTEYKVVKLSAGYAIKTLPTYESAKAYADKCCKANNNTDYTVCAWVEGKLVEIEFTTGDLMGCVMDFDIMLDMQPERFAGMTAQQAVEYYASREVFTELEQDLGVGFMTYEKHLQLIATCKDRLLAVAHNNKLN